MWVFAAGMFRSGSTLQFQLISAMVERAGRGRRMPWAVPEAFGGLATEHDASDELMVFKTHVCKHPMRERLADGRAKAISVHRDIRDIVVSGAQKRGVEPDVAYCRETVTGVMACVEGWSRSQGILELSYTALTESTADSCLRMAAFLGIPMTPSEAEGLAEEFGPDRQRARIERAVADDALVAPHPEWDARCVPGEQLHVNHLADGATGKWRGVLSVEAVGVIEDIAGAWMHSRGYRLERDRSREGAA